MLISKKTCIELQNRLLALVRNAPVISIPHFWILSTTSTKLISLRYELFEYTIPHPSHTNFGKPWIELTTHPPQCNIK